MDNKNENLSLQLHETPGTFLIDRIRLYGITVIDIDPSRFDDLVAAGIVSFKEGLPEEQYLTTVSGDEYTSIKIKDDPLFNLLKITNDYSRLELTINDPVYSNLFCYSLDQYRKRLQDIESHLLNNYGIAIDTSNASISSIELNITVITDEPFNSYARVLTVIMNNLSGRHRFVKDYRNPFSKRSSGSRTEYQIYNKSDELKKKLKIKDSDKDNEGGNLPENDIRQILRNNIIRFEISLNKAERIRTKLNTNNFWDLSVQDIQTPTVTTVYNTNEIQLLYQK